VIQRQIWPALEIRKGLTGNYSAVAKRRACGEERGAGYSSLRLFLLLSAVRGLKAYPNGPKTEVWMNLKARNENLLSLIYTWLSPIYEPQS
jgi:hypothetical protein